MHAALIHHQLMAQDPLDAGQHAVRALHRGLKPGQAHAPQLLVALLVRAVSDNPLPGQAQVADGPVELVVEHLSPVIFARYQDALLPGVIAAPGQGCGVVVAVVQAAPGCEPRRLVRADDTLLPHRVHQLVQGRKLAQHVDAVVGRIGQLQPFDVLDVFRRQVQVVLPGGVEHRGVFRGIHKKSAVHPVGLGDRVEHQVQLVVFTLAAQAKAQLREVVLQQLRGLLNDDVINAHNGLDLFAVVQAKEEELRAVDQGNGHVGLVH